MSTLEINACGGGCFLVFLTRDVSGPGHGPSAPYYGCLPTTDPVPVDRVPPALVQVTRAGPVLVHRAKTTNPGPVPVHRALKKLKSLHVGLHPTVVHLGNSADFQGTAASST